jgi:ribosomal protein S1
MKYWFIDFEEEQYWIEVSDSNIALRQLVKEEGNVIRISCIEDCLAEGVIDIEELEGKILEISMEEFEKVWSNETKPYRNLWEVQKEIYQIGNIVEGEIKYFYPQGVIMQIGEAKGIYVNKKENNANSGYPLDTIKGIVKGYDDKNMWIIISTL